MPWIFSRVLHRAAWVVGAIIGLAGLLSLDAQDSSKTDIHSIVSSSSSTSSEKSNTFGPHPWLADTPPGLARLVDLGNVQLVVDQPVVDAANRTALTVFSFSMKYRMRYRLHESSKEAPKKRSIQISVSYHDVDCEAAHKILLSDRYRPAKPWDSTLLRHEFDHVAISTDPRLFKMIRSLDGRRTTLALILDAETKTSDSWAKREIEKSVSEFQKSIESLVRAYYVRLDKASSDGLSPIEGRAAFFSEIYSVHDLEQRQFPYLNEVRERIGQVTSEQILQHYGLSLP